jgi:hypothetical protein
VEPGRLLIDLQLSIEELRASPSLKNLDLVAPWISPKDSLLRSTPQRGVKAARLHILHQLIESHSSGSGQAAIRPRHRRRAENLSRRATGTTHFLTH